MAKSQKRKPVKRAIITITEGANDPDSVSITIDFEPELGALDGSPIMAAVEVFAKGLLTAKQGDSEVNHV